METEKPAISMGVQWAMLIFAYGFFYAVILFSRNHISQQTMWFVFLVIPFVLTLVGQHVFLRKGIILKGSKFTLIFMTICGSSILAVSTYYVFHIYHH